MRCAWTVNDFWMNYERIPNAHVLLNKCWTALLCVLHALKKRSSMSSPGWLLWEFERPPLPYLPANWQLWNCFALRSSQSHVGSCASHPEPWHEHLRRWRLRFSDRIKRAKHLLLTVWIWNSRWLCDYRDMVSAIELYHLATAHIWSYSPGRPSHAVKHHKCYHCCQVSMLPNLVLHIYLLTLETDWTSKWLTIDLAILPKHNKSIEISTRRYKCVRVRLHVGWLMKFSFCAKRNPIFCMKNHHQSAVWCRERE